MPGVVVTQTPVTFTVTLPATTTAVVMTRYAALATSLWSQFGSILQALDCSPYNGVVPTWSTTPTTQQVAAFEAVVNGWSFNQQPIEAFEQKVLA